MGYEPWRFVDKVDDEFHCSICTLVMKEPMQTPCDHLFCDKCIKEWIATDGSCPVDRRPLKIEDLKPAARFFRSLLDKLEVKCDFVLERSSCQAIIRLEQLENHRINCVYNPDAEVVCDNGCGMLITRQELEAKNCFSHLACHINSMESEIRKLHYQLCSQEERFEHMQKENTQLRDEVDRQSEQVAKLNDKVNRLQQEKTSNITDNSNILLKWREFDNMQISNSSNILEAKLQFSSAFAQSFYSLEPVECNTEIVFASFKAQVFSGTSDVAIGLTNNGHPVDIGPGFHDGSVGYFSYGVIQANGKIEKGDASWESGDMIECLIEFPRDFIYSRYYDVYFFRNGKLISKTSMPNYNKGIHPAIFISSGDAKIKYLTT